MSYSVNDAKTDPDTGLVAVKTGMTKADGSPDAEKSWQIVKTSDCTCHYATDDDVAGWIDLIKSGGQS